jgi:hypothetical protein
VRVIKPGLTKAKVMHGSEEDLEKLMEEFNVSWRSISTSYLRCLAVKYKFNTGNYTMVLYEYGAEFKIDT